ncbi:MAG: hypothetical protein WDN44_11715 [Sphingomonas sp.]
MTDPATLVSPADPDARPVPIDDLGFSRGSASSVWSADGSRIFISTNLTGRYNIWRVDAAGSWPVQIAASEDSQSGLAVSPDGRRSISSRIRAATSNMTSTPSRPTAARPST